MSISESLVDRALEVQRKLEEQGALEDAKVIEQLVLELTSAKPAAERPYYTVSEAAHLIGVSGQTIKNWVSRGMLNGYRLGGRIVVPLSELADYRSMAEASRAIEPLPSKQEIVAAVQAGRRHFIWPVVPDEHSS